MRVLHVIQSLDPSMGGLPKTAAALPSAMASEGAQTALLHYSTPEQEEALTREYGDFPGFSSVQRLAILSPNRVEWGFNRQALRLASEFQPDLVHTHGIWEPLLRNSLAWARHAGLPSVILPQSMLHPWQNQNKKLAKALLRGPLGWKRQWRGAAFWQALTLEEKEHLAAQGVAGRIEVVPNGIFAEEVNPAPPEGAFAHKFPGLAGRPYLLSLARLAPQKAPDVLLEAFALIAPRIPELCLVLAGPDYGLAATLASRVQALGLADRVFLPGALHAQTKREALAGARAFCLPSRAEGFSLALVEAAAFGLPLILSPECYFDEMVKAGGARLAPVEPAALAEALVSVAGDSARAATMGRAARDCVLKHYTWPGLARRLLDLYKECMP